jgi:purine nucleoside permease
MSKMGAGWFVCAGWGFGRQGGVRDELPKQLSNSRISWAIVGGMHCHSMMNFRFRPFILIMATVLGASTNPVSAVSEAPLPIKVVVVTMFEIGEDTGDIPGEFQRWVERGEFDQKIEFPLGLHDIYHREDGVMVICTAGGVTNATATIMALGQDRRFDLSKAYWVIAGIAGADPEDCSLGSAAWAKWVVDGDLAYEIDGREIPEDWAYGFIALGAHEPNSLEDGWTVDTIAYELNASLVEWAYALTKDVELPDHPELVEFRAQFAAERPNAAKPPFVLIGDSLGSSTYWHGALLNDWANDWMKLHTDGAANFVMSNMEDNGTVTALWRLSRTRLVDPQRVLVLRTASNFSMPPPGKDAGWSTTAPYPANGRPAGESAYLVANTVVEALVRGWNEFVDFPPSP